MPPGKKSGRRRLPPFQDKLPFGMKSFAPILLAFAICGVGHAVDYEKDISTAVNSPRFHYQGLPDRIIAEPEAISAEVIQDLELRGYTVKPFIRYGAAESIAIDLDTGLIEAVNDRRKSAGQALAY